ncbi:MAG: molybdopterin molybdotransferase MoeA, partial [Limnobacter sp.]|nr:molybdopterin molybdotransferase MoeA [Limnobacter sp.]
MTQPFLTVSQAKETILESLVPLSDTHSVAIWDALNRVLAKDILSSIDVPAHNNSAMDGYALNSADLRDNGPTRLSVVGTVKAGVPFDKDVEPGQCVRIMTGAVMPENTDTVVIQENIQSDGDHIVFEQGAVGPKDNCRLKGEDLSVGKPALKAGKMITPADLGLLASLGVGEIPIVRKVKVAFFSTGDELRSIGQPLDPGCIYDSNRY